GRYPVKQHANAALVEIVDEVHEVLRSPIAAGGSEVPGRLVAPGAIKRMLHDGHEFHVGETQALDLRGQFGRNLAIAQRTMLLFRDAHPGAQVHFVDGDGAGEAVALAPPPHPLLVSPKVVQVVDHRGCLGRYLAPESKRVGLFDSIIVAMGDDVVLIARSRRNSRNEALPDAGLPPGTKRMT